MMYVIQHFLCLTCNSTPTHPASAWEVIYGAVTWCCPRANVPLYKISTLGTSHTKLMVSEWYARVSLPMRSIECSRCLREVLYTYILGFLTSNNGMPSANIFDILVCVRASLLGSGKVVLFTFKPEPHGKEGSSQARSPIRCRERWWAQHAPGSSTCFPCW